ncbi:MAG: c-type cytochrome [Gammaproteobacteria bacterium]|nr:c-type cytochrome [Gammaproteobacteria bacterium]MDH5778613.1 c-type cytochrome [Gammaproteobacteria bacterium]
MNKSYFLPLLFAGLVLLISGCSKEEESRGQDQAAGSTSAEPLAVTNIDPVLSSKGKALYEQNCVFCHQADAIGKPGFAPSLTNEEFLQVSSDKFLMGTIRDGRQGTGMPPFAHLGRKDVEAIVAYLRSHATLPNMSAQVDAQPRSQGDERLGRFWFESICATCHGPNGDGYVAGSTGTAIGKAGFLDKVSDGFIRETIKQGRSNTRMIGYSGPEAMAALSDADIDDVIAYLRTVPSKTN